MNKKLNNEMEIFASLASIKECTKVAQGYINGEYKVNDIEELIVALSCIPEEIEEIKKLIFNITQEYEREIMELKNERL